jgi:hypothetical protein
VDWKRGVAYSPHSPCNNTFIRVRVVIDLRCACRGVIGRVWPSLIALCRCARAERAAQDATGILISRILLRQALRSPPLKFLHMTISDSTKDCTLFFKFSRLSKQGITLRLNSWTCQSTYAYPTIFRPYTPLHSWAFKSASAWSTMYGFNIAMRHSIWRLHLTYWAADVYPSTNPIARNTS